MPGDVVRISNEIPQRVSTTIPSGQSMSGVVDLQAQLMAAVRVPPSSLWTSANLTFMVSMDGGVTFGDLWKDGSEYAVVVGTGRVNATVYDLDPKDFSSFTHVRVRSGTATTPVNQGADRELQVGRMP